MGNEQQRTFSLEQKQKLDSGKPVLLPGRVKVIKNPRTGKLEGIPQEWKNNQIKLPYQIDDKKLAKTKNLPNQIRPQCQLPQAIVNLINSQPVQYQKSKNKQNIELDLGVDLQQKYGIKNLPNEWVQKLNSSKISPQDVRKDPKATIDMITNFEEELRQSVIQTTIMTHKQFQDLVSQVQFIEQNPASLFIFQRELGKGAMCKVFYAKDRKLQNKKEYACRIIKMNDTKTLNKIKIQIAVMTMCHDKNLVNYYFAYYYKQSLFMFVQYMNAGALTDFVYHYTKKIPEAIIAYITRQILFGLESLHQKRQLHRDLKSDNILLSYSGDVKIADFGFAMQLTKQKLNRKSVVGTPAWMPPELIKKEQYNQKVDIWSLGMVVIQLCNGQPPYLKLPHLKAMHNIVSKQPPRIQGFSPNLCDFVQKCLQKNPQKRWTTSQLLKHQFITEINSGKQAKKQFIQYLATMRKGCIELQSI